LRKGGILLFALGLPVYTHNSPVEKKPYPFALIDPDSGVEIIEGRMVFGWEKKEDPDIPESIVDYYEISFWSWRRPFRKSYVVSSGDSSNQQIVFILDECREVFRRHGKYYWQVTAVGQSGRRRVSEIRSFYVGIRQVGKGFTRTSYPFEIQYQYTNRLRTHEYKTFLNNLTPNTNLRSFSDVSLIFNQRGVLRPTIDFKERFFIVSQMGVGVELASRFRLLRNTYCSLHPGASLTTSWFATGLREYTSHLYSFKVGLDWEIMPGGNVTVKTNWIPSHKIRYSEKDGSLRTFQGKGWEFGVRLIIPNKILKPFHLFGREVDFARIPIEFNVTQIEDEYTGTTMNVRRLSIGYLL
jgi:hypothetical protein